jgi:hypothetical protein
VAIPAAFLRRGYQDLDLGGRQIFARAPIAVTLARWWRDWLNDNSVRKWLNH